MASFTSKHTVYSTLNTTWPYLCAINIQLKCHVTYLSAISDRIPKNIPADLNTLIHVSGDFFFCSGKEGGVLLMAEGCRAYRASLKWWLF